MNRHDLMLLLAGVAVGGFTLGFLGRMHLPKLRAPLRRLWIGLTYWPVACDGCHGTGVCDTRESGGPPGSAHSCCQCPGRKYISVLQAAMAASAAGFDTSKFHIGADGLATLGDGRMWVRPWALRKQVEKPRR